MARVGRERKWVACVSMGDMIMSRPTRHIQHDLEQTERIAKVNKWDVFMILFSSLVSVLSVINHIIAAG